MASKTVSPEINESSLWALKRRVQDQVAELPSITSAAPRGTMGLTRAQRSIFLYLIWCADPQKRWMTWVSPKTIAKNVGMKKGSVETRLCEMGATRLISQRRSSNGKLWEIYINVPLIREIVGDVEAEDEQWAEEAIPNWENPNFSPFDGPPPLRKLAASEAAAASPLGAPPRVWEEDDSEFNLAEGFDPTTVNLDDGSPDI